MATVGEYNGAKICIVHYRKDLDDLALLIHDGSTENNTGCIIPSVRLEDIDCGGGSNSIGILRRRLVRLRPPFCRFDRFLLTGKYAGKTSRNSTNNKYG